MPQGKAAIRRARLAGLAEPGRQSWRFLACVCLLQGAHAAYYGFSAIYWQGRDILLPPWAICGRWAWWPK
jgi:PPP family 3-phenylpropionic acid transporter